MTLNEKFFGLLRAALWAKPVDFPISPDEAAALVDLAARQTVSGLIIDQLIKNEVRMERNTLLQAYALLERIKQQNESMNAKVAAFARLMDETATNYLIVKGQTLAALYPEPSVRMSGDIDVLVRDYRHAVSVLREHWQADLPDRFPGKETAFSHDDAIYELHTYLIGFGSNRHRRRWEQALADSAPEAITIGGARVSVMQPTLNAAYIFMHMFFHFVGGGVGLRQLCDWGVAMHHYADKIDARGLEELLRQLGLLRAFRAFGTILVDRLGMPDFPLPLSAKDRRMQPLILRDMLDGGNFGRSRRKVKRIGLLHKAETGLLTLTSSLRYLRLAPLELSLQVHRKVVNNCDILSHRLRTRRPND